MVAEVMVMVMVMVAEIMLEWLHCAALRRLVAKPEQDGILEITYFYGTKLSF